MFSFGRLPSATFINLYSFFLLDNIYQYLCEISFCVLKKTIIQTQEKKKTRRQEDKKTRRQEEKKKRQNEDVECIIQFPP